MASISGTCWKLQSTDKARKRKNADRNNESGWHFCLLRQLRLQKGWNPKGIPSSRFHRELPTSESEIRTRHRAVTYVYAPAPCNGLQRPTAHRWNPKDSRWLVALAEGRSATATAQVSAAPGWNPKDSPGLVAAPSETRLLSGFFSSWYSIDYINAFGRRIAQPSVARRRIL